MDLLSLGVILLILAVSGGIAFVADGLGKKIGKKRLSVAGLRPKHVAQIGTVGMGVFVSGLTIGFIMAVSGDARQWLIRGRKILAANEKLQEANVDLQALNKGFKIESLQIRQQNDAVKGKNAQLSEANQKLGGVNAKLGLDLARERGDLEGLKNERQGLLAQKSELGRQVADLGKGLRLTQTTLEESRGDLERVRGSLEAYQGSVRRAQAEIRRTQASLVVTKANLAVALKNLKDALTQGHDTYVKNVDLQQAVTDGEAKVADLTQRQKRAEQDYEAAKANLETANANLDEVSKQVALLANQEEQQKSFLQGGYRTSRTEAMIFRKGEELARVVVPAGTNREEATAALASLLREARIEAQSRGAKPRQGNGESFEAADIVERKEPKTGEVFRAEVLKLALAAQATGRREDEALVATSSLNAFTGEVVSLDVSMMPNPVVYRRNEAVAEAQIDGAQSEDRILAQLSDFYNGRVRDRAVRDRMIPRVGSPTPFGGIPDADVLDLVQNVKKAGKPVRVQAVAKGDIRAADPLRLEFRVR